MIAAFTQTTTFTQHLACINVIHISPSTQYLANIMSGACVCLSVCADPITHLSDPSSPKLPRGYFFRRLVVRSSRTQVFFGGPSSSSPPPEIEQSPILTQSFTPSIPMCAAWVGTGQKLSGGGGGDIFFALPLFDRGLKARERL